MPPEAEINVNADTVSVDNLRTALDAYDAYADAARVLYTTTETIGGTHTTNTAYSVPYYNTDPEYMDPLHRVYRNQIDTAELERRIAQVEVETQRNNIGGDRARDVLRAQLRNDIGIRTQLQELVIETLQIEMERYTRKIYKTITEHIKLDITEEEFMKIITMG